MPELDHPPQNREERRRLRFGPKGDRPPFPTPDDAAPGEARAGAPDRDVTALTGPGTGGATESAGRTPHHTGAHVSVTPKA